jgi:hypothetical protein
MVEAWIGKGLLMPCASRAETMCAATPSSAKPPGCSASVEEFGVLMIVTSLFARGGAAPAACGRRMRAARDPLVWVRVAAWRREEGRRFSRAVGADRGADRASGGS